MLQTITVKHPKFDINANILHIRAKPLHNDSQYDANLYLLGNKIRKQATPKEINETLFGKINAKHFI